MVSREECVTAINKFIKTKDLNTAVSLFVYLCELKGMSDAREIETITSNPTFMVTLLPNVLEELQIALNINKITDRNNTLITVY